jgi:hypothetical protein
MRLARVRTSFQYRQPPMSTKITAIAGATMISRAHSDGPSLVNSPGSCTQRDRLSKLAGPHMPTIAQAAQDASEPSLHRPNLPLYIINF